MRDVIRINENVQLFCWACGIASYFLFFFSIIPLMEFIPPPLPALSGEEFVAKYFDNPGLLKAGTIAGMVAGGLLLPWTVMVAMQIIRMEAGRPPVLALLSVCGGIGNALFTIICFMLWAGAFYRPERDPELIRLMSDTSWLIFIMLWPPYVCQLIATGTAGLTSSAKEVVLPRWFCFMSLWTALLMCPGSFAVMFFKGPFAWNGILAFWVVVVVFGIYNIIAFFAFFKAIRNQARELKAGVGYATATP